MINVTIGKYTLETLTAGMYNDVRDFVREYIQNSADAIDDAIKKSIINTNEGIIQISIIGNDMIIEDNGSGIKAADSIKYLVDIGNSKKIKTNERGFRGIGRLSGLAYCDKLIFETSAYNEEKVTIVEFDALELEKKLYEESNIELEGIIKSVINYKIDHCSTKEHYFKVRLVNLKKIDELYSLKKLSSYLTQVAPAPFSQHFSFAKEIIAKLEMNSCIISQYKMTISVDGVCQEIEKNYEDTFYADRVSKVKDSIIEININPIIVNSKTVAVMWYAELHYLGTVQDEQVRGIRLRKGNIQLGDFMTLNKIYSEERFNGWNIGEIHIISDELIPNGRRDDLEKNETYFAFISELKKWGHAQSQKIRRLSSQRSLTKKENGIVTGKISTVSDDMKKEIVERLSAIVENNEENNNMITENQEVAHRELLKTVNQVFDITRGMTKYKVLNLQSGLTIEQKKTMEQVIDVLILDGNRKDNDSIITEMIKRIASNNKIK